MFYGVPTLYEYLKDHKDTNKTDWKRLKLVLSGADTLHESTMHGWAKRTGSNIIEGYGLSESCATSHVNPLHRPKTGLLRLPHPGHGGRRGRPGHARIRRPGRPESLSSGPERDAGVLETARGKRAGLHRKERCALDAHR